MERRIKSLLAKQLRRWLLKIDLVVSNSGTSWRRLTSARACGSKGKGRKNMRTARIVFLRGTIAFAIIFLYAHIQPELQFLLVCGLSSFACALLFT